VSRSAYRTALLRHPLRTSVAALALARDTRLSEKEWADANDETLAHLLRYRRRAQRAQGWFAIVAFVAAFSLMLGLAVLLPAHTVLAVLTAMVAALAMGVGFLLDRATKHAFVRLARSLGLSTVASEDLYARTNAVGGYLDALSCHGGAVTDSDIAGFVREADAQPS